MKLAEGMARGVCIGAASGKGVSGAAFWVMRALVQRAAASIHDPVPGSFNGTAMIALKI